MNTKEEVFELLQRIGCDPEIFFTKVRPKGSLPSKEEYNSYPFFWELFKDKDLKDKNVQYEMKELSIQAYDLCCEIWIEMIKKIHDNNFKQRNDDVADRFPLYRYNQIKKLLKKMNMLDIEEFKLFKKNYKKFKKTSIDLLKLCNKFKMKWQDKPITSDNYDNAKSEMNIMKELYLNGLQPLIDEFHKMYEIALARIYEINPPNYD